MVVRGVEKQERPGGRLKAEIRPLVSLPTAKPLVGSLTSCQEPHTAEGEKRAPEGGFPPAGVGELRGGFLSDFLVLV